MLTHRSSVLSSILLGSLICVLGVAACGSDEEDADEGVAMGGQNAVAAAGKRVTPGGTNGVGGTSPAAANLSRGGSAIAATSSAPASFSRGGASSGLATTSPTALGRAGSGSGPTGFGGQNNRASGGNRHDTVAAAGGIAIDVNCVSGRTCSQNCSAPCPTGSNSNYSCVCDNGRLDCDVAACTTGSSTLTSCLPDSTCTADCIGTCPDDSASSYSCRCSKSGRLDCDLSACEDIDITDVACSATVTNGAGCDGASDTLCNPTAGGSDILCFCNPLSNTWTCL